MRFEARCRPGAISLLIAAMVIISARPCLAHGSRQASINVTANVPCRVGPPPKPKHGKPPPRCKKNMQFSASAVIPNRDGSTRVVRRLGGEAGNHDLVWRDTLKSSDSGPASAWDLERQISSVVPPAWPELDMNF